MYFTFAVLCFWQLIFPVCGVSVGVVCVCVWCFVLFLGWVVIYFFWVGGELQGKRGKSGKELLLIPPQHSSHALETATCSKRDPG